MQSKACVYITKNIQTIQLSVSFNQQRKLQSVCFLKIVKLSGQSKLTAFKQEQQEY